MAKVSGVCVGESLVGDGNEVAHVDLLIGPRGSPVESALEKGDEVDFVGGRGGHARVSELRARWYCRSRSGDCLMHHFC
jgi:formaldehyde-activating enzyme (Fae)